MAEVTKRTGAGKKREAQPEAPLLLKDGKTPASDSALTRALHRYNLPVPATTAEKLEAVRTRLEADLKEKLSAHTCTPDCDDPAKTQCPMVVCACTEVSTLETDFCPFCGDLGLPLDAQQLPDSPVSPPLPAITLEQEAPTMAPEGEVLPPVPADKAAALDAAVLRIERLKGDINKNTWELAAELKRVQDDELYKARGYENFGAWAVGEVQLSRSLAYELVRVASEFDKDTYLEVGSTKLRLIAGIEDPEKRQAALEDAKGGASKRELEAAHTTRAVTRDAPAPEPVKKSTPPAPEVVSAREVPKKGNEIQLLVKLNGRATTHPFLSAKTSREIKEYAEDAYVELRLADNVVLHMAPKFDRDGKKLVGLTVKAIETVEPS